MKNLAWNKEQRFAAFSNGTTTGFGPKGTLLTYYAEYYPQEGIEIKDVSKPFDAILQYKTYRKGRSAINFIWIDLETSAEYSMFISSMDELIQLGGLRGSNTVVASWQIIKQGSNYGIALHKLVK